MQIALFLTINLGLKKEILQNDIYVTITKITCVILSAISVYAIVLLNK